jgi:hypothetical protein
MGNCLGIAAAVVGVSAAVACGGSQNPGETSGLGSSDSASVQIPKVDPSLCNSAGKEIITFDLNKDGKPDVWKLYNRTEEGGTRIDVLTCKQVDLDHDGRKDYVVTYNSNGGKLTEEFDFDFDGRFDARHFYDEKSSQVYLVERDSDYDKKPDIWEKYNKQGVLESVRRDRNADGKADVWEQYKDGHLIAILWDDDFDTRVDRKDEMPGDPSRPASGGNRGEESESESESEPTPAEAQR